MTTRRLSLLLQTLVLIAPAALADGMLVPGWGPIAGQALGDIQAAATQMQPQAPNVTRPPSSAQVPAARAAIETYTSTQNGNDQGRDTDAQTDALVAPLWAALAGNEAASANGADRVARAFTLGNATAQLANGVYGGPPGAAAYATWWAYQQAGANATVALRVGLLAGIGLWGVQKDADGIEVPARIIQRSTLAAALGGLAIAAAGGDEQTLREVFFDPGAALLIQDGGRVYCLSAQVQCQHPPATAALYKDGRFAGWALDQLAPLAHPGLVPPGTPGRLPTTTPMSLRDSGSLPLDQGWTLSWQIPQGIEPGALFPVAVLSRGAPPSGAPALPSPTTLSSRYLCELRGDTRTIWVVPGDAQAGYVCRTMYQVDKTRAVLWNALQNPQVCEAKARAQVAREQAHGYQCRPAEP